MQDDVAGITDSVMAEALLDAMMDRLGGITLVLLMMPTGPGAVLSSLLSSK